MWRLLFRLACECLISARVIRPGPVTVVERVAHARKQAQSETYDRLAHEFTPERCAELDALLATDVSIGMSRLRWLSTGPVEASAEAVKAEVDKLGFLRGLGADSLDMSEQMPVVSGVGKGIESSTKLNKHRRVIERSIAWLFGYHRLSIRYERYANHFCAFLTLAAALTCYKRLVQVRATK